MTQAPHASANGFWAQAAQDPERTVLIAPDGEKWTAGRLHTEANRLVHGLRAAGLERGDAFAVVLPNSVRRRRGPARPPCPTASRAAPSAHVAGAARR